METTTRWLVFGALVAMLAPGAVVNAATDVAPPTSDVQSESTATPPSEESTPAVVEPAKPKIEKPKAADKPKPVEPPRVAPAKPKPPVTEPPRAVSAVPQSSVPPEPAMHDQPPAPAAEMVASEPPAADKEPAGRPLACWIFSFAMLVVGFVAGFIARHLWSRRQLGGMTVRIGTWRGIP